MKEYLKQKLIAALKAAAQAGLTALLTALGLGALGSTSGCTVVVPNDDAKSVSVTGAIPLGIQLNTNPTK